MGETVDHKQSYSHFGEGFAKKLASFKEFDALHRNKSIALPMEGLDVLSMLLNDYKGTSEAVTQMQLAVRSLKQYEAAWARAVRGETKTSTVVRAKKLNSVISAMSKAVSDLTAAESAVDPLTWINRIQDTEHTLISETAAEIMRANGTVEENVPLDVQASLMDEVRSSITDDIRHQMKLVMEADLRDFRAEKITGGCRGGS